MYSRTLHRRLVENLPPDRSSELVHGGLCEVGTNTLSGFVHPSVHQQIEIAQPRDGIRLSSNTDVTVGFFDSIVSRTRGESLRVEIREANWVDEVGLVRDQGQHSLCWDFVSLDLISAHMFISGDTHEFMPLSAWDLCMNCQSWMLGTDEDAWRRGHMCYACHVSVAVQYVWNFGVIRPIFDENVAQYMCFYPSEHARNVNTLVRPRIRSLTVTPSLWQALEHLTRGPIAADLITYRELYASGNLNYKGPMNPDSRFYGYHAAIITSIGYLHGELVAFCKLCNGLGVGTRGHVTVSLETMFMVLDASESFEHKIGATQSPSHLFTRFTLLEMYPPEREIDKKKKRPQGEEDNSKREEEDNSKRRRFFNTSAGSSSTSDVTSKAADPSVAPRVLRYELPSLYDYTENMGENLKAIYYLATDCLKRALGDTPRFEFMRDRRILEISPDHPIILDLNAACQNATESSEATRVADLLYGTAIISSGFTQADQEHEKEKSNERIAKLSGGVAVIQMMLDELKSGGRVYQSQQLPQLRELEVIYKRLNISGPKVALMKEIPTIVGDGTTQHAVPKCVTQIKNLIEQVDQEHEKEKSNERIRKLSGGVAVIQAAVEEVIVVGGGRTLLPLAAKVDAVKASLTNDEEKVGEDIVKTALSYPLKLIAKNAGVTGSVVSEKWQVLTNDNVKYGYNAAMFPVARLKIDGNMEAHIAALKVLGDSHDLEKFPALKAELRMRQPLYLLGY